MGCFDLYCFICGNSCYDVDFNELENIEDDSTTTVSQGPFAEAYAEDIRVRNEGNL